MAKEKATLTLDAEKLAAVDEWLREPEDAHGPIPPETLEWAGQLVNDWARRTKRRKAR